MTKQNKAVLYTTIGGMVIGSEETWQADNNLAMLNQIFDGAVDVVCLLPAMDGKLGIDFWLRDDAFATGQALPYQIQYGDSYYGMVFLPANANAAIALQVDEEGNTFAMTQEAAHEVMTTLVISPWNRGEE
ncbi:hypothetical protein BKY29_07325 [Weissella confusa]|uniref:hypothetical protein n=1 Tax=Weissella confusa TaxID=1583 RepID=UPI0008FE9476|nr:hypothetical protein [Weissella confusa]OJF03304.1 hypothetical protein BKY29_07325 [Weissella confusa]